MGSGMRKMSRRLRLGLCSGGGGMPLAIIFLGLARYMGDNQNPPNKSAG